MLDQQENAVKSHPTDPERQADGKWVPGKAGGPGRPKGFISLTERLKRRLQEHPEEAEAIVQAAVDGAMGGDPKLMSIVLDRHDGLLKQQLEMSGHVVSERRIVIVGAMAEQPALPASILQLEAQREEAEQRAQVNRAREVEDEGEES